jgi:CRISPR-associated endonuclease Csn1
MHNDTAYGLMDHGQVCHRVIVEGARVRLVEKLGVIAMNKTNNANRHGGTEDGRPKFYKGYKGDSNYCMDIFAEKNGKWTGEVVSTFEAYQLAKIIGAEAVIKGLSVVAKPAMIFRLRINDILEIFINGLSTYVRVATLSTAGNLALIPLHEANVDARVRKKAIKYIYKTAGSLQKANAKRVTVDCLGTVFK